MAQESNNFSALLGARPEALLLGLALLVFGGGVVGRWWTGYAGLLDAAIGYAISNALGGPGDSSIVLVLLLIDEVSIGFLLGWLAYLVLRRYGLGQETAVLIVGISLLIAQLTVFSAEMAIW